MEPTDEKIKMLLSIQEYFLNEQKPLNFDPYTPGNVISEGETGLEEICATMEENGVTHPKKLTEWEFYSKLLFYQKKYKRLESGSK